MREAVMERCRATGTLPDIELKDGMKKDPAQFLKEEEARVKG
jgi:hypothetical protein